MDCFKHTRNLHFQKYMSFSVYLQFHNDLNHFKWLLQTLLEKCRKTSYLDTFHAVRYMANLHEKLPKSFMLVWLLLKITILQQPVPRHKLKVTIILLTYPCIFDRSKTISRKISTTMYYVESTNPNSQIPIFKVI